jgi:hypothetical protein
MSRTNPQSKMKRLNRLSAALAMMASVTGILATGACNDPPPVGTPPPQPVIDVPPSMYLCPATATTPLSVPLHVGFAHAGDTTNPEDFIFINGHLASGPGITEFTPHEGHNTIVAITHDSGGYSGQSAGVDVTIVSAGTKMPVVDDDLECANEFVAEGEVLASEPGPGVVVSSVETDPAEGVDVFYREDVEGDPGAVMLGRSPAGIWSVQSTEDPICGVDGEEDTPPEDAELTLFLDCK